MSIYVPATGRELSHREKTVLRAIVQLFVLNASPVGSRMLARYIEDELALSAASIRNVMADLEDWGFITHPHTSAGRMPTDQGYRTYVDSLMGTETLSHQESKVVDELALRPRETILRDTSILLGTLSRALAVVRVPRFTDIIVNKVELFPISSNRLLVVLALESDIVRTVTMETGSILDPGALEAVSRQINEKMSGRPLRVIGEALGDFGNVSNGERTLLRLFVEHVDRLTTVDEQNDVHLAGARQLLSHPEFEHPERMRSIIELLENEDIIVHMVDGIQDNVGVQVRIGNELHSEQLHDYSLITTTYRIGHANGSISLIGPKRMNYSKLMSLVHTVGNVLSSSLHSDIP